MGTGEWLEREVGLLSSRGGWRVSSELPYFTIHKEEVLTDVLTSSEELLCLLCILEMF